MNQLLQANKDIEHSAKRLRLTVSYCDEHPDEHNRLYCYDCKVVACHMCFVEKHDKHHLTDVNKSAEKFREQLNEDVNELAGTALKKQDEIIKLEADTRKFMDKVVSTESEISKKYGQLITRIQSHQSQLIQELNSFKDRNIEMLETEIDKIKNQFVITESIKNDCQEVINNGTACDISRVAHDLHARAEELVKTQDEHQLSGVEVTFTPSLFTADIVKNLIGELVLKGRILLWFL